MKIHQFHPSIVKGDAISNEIFLIQQILIKHHYDSQIYACNIGDGLENKIKKLSSIKINEEDVLIVHHSMGFDDFDFITNLKCKKVLIYHNITPENFFDNEYIKKYVRLGLRQTEKYKDYMNLSYADSNFSRRELIAMGYKNVGVIPVQISLNRFDDININKELDEKLKNNINILFVGRIVKNKKQIDVIKAYEKYKNLFNNTAKIYLIGDLSNIEYVTLVNNYIKRNGLENDVILTGKVSEEDLKTYYSNASIFLCMSEHEGFGVPLLEAMKNNVPVLAYESSAIKETMDIGGITFTDKDYNLIAGLIDEIVLNKELKNKIISVQKERIDKLVNTDTEKLILQLIDDLKNKKQEKLQLQGPFETSYSLAIINKELIEHINKKNEFDVSLYATEGPGDYDVDPKNLVDKPLAKKLYLKSKDVVYPDITIRNMYPPRVNDVNGAINFQYFAWEESVIPEDIINNFNNNLNAIGTLSEFVTNQLIENGINIPVTTTGNGVFLPDNFNTLPKYKLKTKKKIKFLNISSAFPRKGIDVLLKAYFKAFNKNDDVCLVLKSFPNPHNKIEEMLKKYQNENSPEVEWINKDLSKDQLYGLYKACDCYVSTSRGEGFGLPIAEAMLAKIPTIVCNNSGMKDFANENTSLVYSYEIEKSNTHIKINNKISTWFEPKIDELISLLKYFYANKDSDKIKEIVNNAYKFISEEYSWDKVADKWINFINDIKEHSYHHKVALVSTWNSKCGIAEYSKLLYNSTKYRVDYEIFPNKVRTLSLDEQFVRKRLWKDASDSNEKALIKSLLEARSDIILIEYNFGFFSLDNLKEIINSVTQFKKIIIEFHKTDDAILNNKKVSLKSIVSSINKCAAIIVHQELDKKRLVSFGVKEEIIDIIHHGQILSPYVPSKIVKEQNGINSKHVIGTYGFLLPHKGQLELIKATKILKGKYDDILLIMSTALFDSKESKEYFNECVKYIKENNLENNVYLNANFVSNEESISILSNADLCVLPYFNTGESASGAVRFVASLNRPLVLSKQPIFEELKDCSYQFERVDPIDIANAINKTFESDNTKMLDNLQRYLKENSWYNISKKYIDLLDKIK